MKQGLVISEEQPMEMEQWKTAGAAVARSIPFEGTRVRHTRREPKRSLVPQMLAQTAGAEAARLLYDNLRLIRTAEKETREFAKGLRHFPLVHDASGAECARVVAIARAYLDCVENHFTEETCAAFLDGFQDVAILEMGELWALKPALQSELLHRLAKSSDFRPALLLSLRQVGDIAWKELFEVVNRIDRVLRTDPAGAFSAMDFDSRDQYRKAIAGLAQHCPASEHEVAETALSLAVQAEAASDGSRAAVRRGHVGYYLLDGGRAALQAAIAYRPPVRERIQSAVLRSPTAFYLIAIELFTFVIVAIMLAGVDSLTPFFAGLLLLLLPATQAAVALANSLATLMVAPRALPRLDFSKGVPEDCATVVAVPTLLLNEAQVRDLVLDLEIRFLANRDPQVYFALLTDCPDADRPFDERDPLADLCAGLIEGLNRRYSGSPFLLLHRHRVYNEQEGRWIGWERKRGKLLDFNRLLRGGFDSFPLKVGDLSVMPRIRYVITLDSDTQLPRDCAARLIGTIAHPLNAAVIDAARGIVVEGYGILQPRIGISIRSAARSRLAALYSGETGFDIYTRAVSDVYQDLFGEGIFTGKGIYEVDVLREVLEQRFPENALLSHDLVEGAYARAALVSDIELIDDYPSHFSAYSRRKHRWMRGDWQTLRWLADSVPDRTRPVAPNPISVISRWKIVDNLRRSLQEPSLVLLLLGAWFCLPGRADYWTAAAAIMPFLTAYWALVFSILRAPRSARALRPWVRQTVRTFEDANATAVLTLVFLLHQALISVDAIVRSILRMFVTGRKLLEWETAAESGAGGKGRSAVDLYLIATPLLSGLLGLLIWRFRPAALSAALPVLALWASSWAVSIYLNRPPRSSSRALRRQDSEWLCGYAERMCRFFRDWSSPATNFLIPDNVHENGEAVMTLSPTNVGLLLNARIAAVHFGALTLAEFAFETSETLARMLEMPKHRGHLLNWYDVATLQPTGTRFVSTVDSGNLAAALWTLKQSALTFASEHPWSKKLTPEISAQLHNIASISDQLVRDMDFAFLYHRRRKVLSVGYDLETGRLAPSYYDLLASESRIATFVAIAKGDIPQESWFHLGRGHTLYGGESILLSWTGTMFEYLMPAIWMRHYRGTITNQTARAVVKAQKEYARRKGVPWGISESACLAPDGSEGYAPFGIPDLALKSADGSALVVSPYSSFLAATVDPAGVLKNLKQMEEYGWSGRYGFYEAVDYSRAGGQPIRSWMCHHQAMSLLAICNLLFDRPFQRYFHAEPYVMATELLLHERTPIGLQAEKEEPVSNPMAQPLPAAAA
jgi:cyclic beta-1,2-glucan synthetase